MKDIRELNNPAASKAHGEWMGEVMKNLNPMATLEIEGELWFVTNLGNETTYHLVHCTVGRLTRGGWSPAQNLIPVEEANKIGVNLSAPPCVAK